MQTTRSMRSLKAALDSAAGMRCGEWATDRPITAGALPRSMASWRRPEHSDLLPGPTGERNTWTLLPRERVLCIADDEQDALATARRRGCRWAAQVLWPDDALHRQLAKASASRPSPGAFSWPKRTTSPRSPLMPLFSTAIPISCVALCEAVAARGGRDCIGRRALPVAKAIFCWRGCTLNAP